MFMPWLTTSLIGRYHACTVLTSAFLRVKLKNTLISACFDTSINFQVWTLNRTLGPNYLCFLYCLGSQVSLKSVGVDDYFFDVDETVGYCICERHGRHY